MALKKDNLPVNVDVDTEQGSSITYANEVVAIIAGASASEVEGIAGMCNVSGNLLGKNRAVTKGVKVEIGTEEASVDLYVVMEYGTPIQKAAYDAQESVRKAIETMTNLHVVSDVAMNAWLPQASYPCGNFSDTSSFKFRRSKGSIGHAFTVRIRTGNQNQTSFYPFVPHEISVLVELILGHLRYLLTDVPPQPNSPPDNVFRPDRPARRALGPKGGAGPRLRLTE